MKTDHKKPAAKFQLTAKHGLLVLLILSLAFNIVILIRDGRVSSRSIGISGRLIGLRFQPSERRMMRERVRRNRSAYEGLREQDIENACPPALTFDPVAPGRTIDNRPDRFRMSRVHSVEAFDNIEDLAFRPLTELSHLIRTRRVTSVELTRMYLDRLKKYGPKLHCVITLTEDLALEQARRADEEIARGKYRGPLHGIPWGAKDLLATKGIPTTWGAMPYKDQTIDENATVVQRLEEAGAVLLVKLSMGALAMGDVWFGGKTRNPWDLEQGSSGSSAGSAAATAAGLVAFAIGTETLGSIVSPCTRCGVTGLRPTYGRVSRAGAMALSWSMDKIGPICRSVEDCAVVLKAIQGPDGKDLTIKDVGFDWDPDRRLENLRIGYYKEAFENDDSIKENDQAVLDTIRAMGVDLIPVELPDIPVQSMRFILIAEAAAAFDALTRSGQDDLLVRQTSGAWPNGFRQARLIPAVEYLQANRVRTELLEKMAALFDKIDVYISPSSGGDNLTLTNLSGHPAVVIPNGFTEENHPTSITVIGDLFGESDALLVAKAFQDATDFHLKHPTLKIGVE